MELKYIKGVSTKRCSDLNKAGINTAEELVKRFPRAYIDLRSPVSLRYAMHNDFVLVRAQIVGVPTVSRYGGKRSVVRVNAMEGLEPFSIVWFNQPYFADKLTVGAEYLFYGRVSNRYGTISLTNPTFELYEENENLRGIVPVYPLTGGINQKVMRSIIGDALDKLPLRTAIPDNLVRKYGLMNLKDAYYEVHDPSDFSACDEASERIAIEEFFDLISAFRVIKGDKEQARINRYRITGKQIAEFSRRFGFELTDGQKRAINEIYMDLTGPKVMNRLLQGDVGSGKTAVAVCALYAAASSGFQAAMIAPTEVLARQNYEIVKGFLPEFQVAFLSGSSTQKEKNAIKKALKSGEISVVCGTHAVLEESVEFASLSLCVCDEQHRFGVSQRSNLVAKGKACDVLVMSATPIPRTLSLIFYGDLDVSTITDKPKARAEVKTGIVPTDKYRKMLSFISEEVERGRQVFFVCPQIEGDAEGSAISVNEIINELKMKLPSVRFQALHGKMRDKEKTQIMLDFKAHKTDALVSTTVIEVGIDVPNATVMVIYGADRFGLSQLHQLRGRVGRGKYTSYCFLLSDSETPKAIERLNVLKDNTDGFKIAECDFDARGSGDIMGTRQSGKTMGNLGALRFTTSTVFLAKRLSDEAFSSPENIPALRKNAMARYEHLKDVTLN